MFKSRNENCGDTWLHFSHDSASHVTPRFAISRVISGERMNAFNCGKEFAKEKREREREREREKKRSEHWPAYECVLN